MTRQTRVDPHLGTVVHIVADRQGRPNLPVDGCPFCVGGLEAPEPYEVRAFKNRWPALEGGTCEVILYSPDHEATLATLPVEHLGRIVDLWCERTTALRDLPGGEHVVVFENRGAEIGATIAHPHGQIYAFDHVPDRPGRMLRASWAPEPNPGDRFVATIDGWRAWCDGAPVFPVSVRLAPIERVADLPALETAARAGLARALSVIFGALEQLFGEPLPYMMWINQSPRTSSQWPDAWMNIEIVSPWRAPRLPRHIAGVEVATGEYFVPVDPADIAARLRDLIG
ncbi:MAG: DUF4931 domain-containing protein [Actinomycetota bacterium]